MSFTLLSVANDGSHAVSLWNSEAAAYQQACYEMICFFENELSSYLEMSDDEVEDLLRDINCLVAAKNYGAAVRKWNLATLNTITGINRFWWINSQTAWSMSHADAPWVLSSSFFASGNNGLNGATNVSAANPAITNNPSPYKASQPGATCRKCHNDNEFAYADKQDGTYLCRQCQMFHSVFGSGNAP